MTGLIRDPADLEAGAAHLMQVCPVWARELPALLPLPLRRWDEGFVAIRDAVATGQLVALATPFLALQRTLSLLVHRKRYRGAALAAFLRMA